MGKINIRTKWFRHDETIELKVKKKGTLRFDTESKISRDRDEYKITSEKSEAVMDLGAFSGGRTPEGFVCNQLIKQGYGAFREKWRDDGFDISYERLDAETAEIVERMQKLEGAKSRLSFKRFLKIEDGRIYAEYAGHETGGSPIKARDVVPGYIEELERETNRRVEWLDKTTGGFGYDAYRFQVDLQDTLEKDFVYKPRFISLKRGATYLATEDFLCGSAWEIKKGAKFTISNVVREWGYYAHVKILSGKARTMVHSGNFGSDEDYSGGGPFLKMEEIAEKLKVDIDDLTISYDAARGSKFPAEPVENMGQDA